ncbi:MAG: hypothetical protein GX776_09175 [Oxalobacter sp.]|nr:hypothetical protein [Oxalobacter sp.]
MTGQITIGNAGLVLAAPFLTNFFRHLGYLDVMRFIDEETHARAIYLLEYMVTGDNGITGDLNLNALLCGWPPGRPVPPPPLLSEVEKQQADLVVEAIRAHWTALGNMTVNDLRHAFMKRRGLLEMGLAYRLTVQAEPQDILLRQIPWVYAVTRTPWSEVIAVEWYS